MGRIHLGHCMGVLQGDSGKPSPFPSLSLPGHEMKWFVLPCIHTIIHTLIRNNMTNQS